MELRDLILEEHMVCLVLVRREFQIFFYLGELRFDRGHRIVLLVDSRPVPHHPAGLQIAHYVRNVLLHIRDFDAPVVQKVKQRAPIRNMQICGSLLLKLVDALVDGHCMFPNDGLMLELYHLKLQ